MANGMPDSNPPNCRFLVYPRFSKSVQCADLARTLYERVFNEMRPSIVAVAPSVRLDCHFRFPHSVPNMPSHIRFLLACRRTRRSIIEVQRWQKA